MNRAFFPCPLREKTIGKFNFKLKVKNLEIFVEYSVSTKVSRKGWNVEHCTEIWLAMLKYTFINIENAELLRKNWKKDLYIILYNLLKDWSTHSF